MRTLIKLEWKKQGLSQYIKYAFICTGLVYAAAFAMAVISVREGEMMFENFQMYSDFYSMILRIVYQVFAAVLLVRLIVDEYTSKTINIMFTYPVSRRKIFAGKMVLAGLFTFAGISLSSVLYALLTLGLQKKQYMYDGLATVQEIMSGLPGMFLAAFMAAGMSLIPLYFGMKKKSGPAVIVAAVILSLLLNGTISGSGNGSSLSEFLIIPMGLSGLGMVIGYMSWHNINRKDI